MTHEQHRRLPPHRVVLMSSRCFGAGMFRDVRQSSNRQVQSAVALHAAIAALCSAVVTVVPAAAAAAGAGHAVCVVFLASCISCGWPAGCSTAATCIC